MRRLVVALVVGSVVFAACGDDDPVDVARVPAEPSADDSTSAGTSEDGQEDQGGGDTSGDEVPEPVGPAEMDTIRIGSQVWERTLPMTTGQCFVQNVEGLPPSGVAWGTLDGDDGIRFSADANQDGSFEAEVDDQESFYWIAGPRSGGPDDLVIELDFDALTIVGQGTFTNVFTGDTAAGSFAFQCEDDGSGT